MRRRPVAWRSTEAEPVAVVVLPWPDRQLSPNRAKGAHWAQVARSREGARAHGALAAIGLDGVISVGEPVEMVVFVEPPDRVRRDLDNIHASLKSYIDGICSRIGFDDAQIEAVSLIRMEPTDGGRVTIELWRA